MPTSVPVTCTTTAVRNVIIVGEMINVGSWMQMLRFDLTGEICISRNDGVQGLIKHREIQEHIWQPGRVIYNKLNIDFIHNVAQLNFWAPLSLLDKTDKDLKTRVFNDSAAISHFKQTPTNSFPWQCHQTNKS